MGRPVGETALMALVFGAGALLPLQALINGRLGGYFGSPLWASAAQNMVGAVAMLCVVALLRPAAPSAAQLGGAPAWAWIGGVLGMVYVFSSLVAAPRLGATRTMAAVIAGQLLASMALDHFGVLHERRPVTLAPVLGALLLVAGATLILRRA